MAPAGPSDGCPSCPVLPGHRLVCVFTTSGLYLKPHLKVFHSTEYLSLLNSPPHIFFIKQAPKTTNLPMALKVSVYKPLETVRNSLITFSKEVTVYRYTNKCHIRCLSPSNEILTQGEREWSWWIQDVSEAKSGGTGESWPRRLRFTSVSVTLTLWPHISSLVGRVERGDQPYSNTVVYLQ